MLMSVILNIELESKHPRTYLYDITGIYYPTFLTKEESPVEDAVMDAVYDHGTCIRATKMMKDARQMDIYFDGGCKPNPGKMEVGVVFHGETSHHDNYGHGTNNQAEWLALLYAMGLAEEKGYTNIHLIGDSKLVISQALGVWKCNQAELRVFLEEFNRRKGAFRSVKLTHVRRHLNLAGIYLEQR